MGTAHVGPNTFLRDRKTGNTYSLGVNWHGMTDKLIENLRDNFVDTNFIGISVLESRDANSFIRRYTGGWGSPEFDRVQKNWRKERAFALKDSGYHTYFGLSANALANESEFDVDDDASKAQIKKSFMKSLKNKKMNKKILNEFVSLVA